MKKNAYLFTFFFTVILLVSLAGCKTGQKIHLGLVATGNLPELTIEETLVVAASEETPDHIEFISLIPQAAWDAHATYKYQPPDALVEDQNAMLEPFGYRLQQNPSMSSYSFQLFKGDELIQDNIAFVHPVTLKGDGSDFCLPLDLSIGRYNQVYFNGRSATWGTREGNHSCRPPVYAGDVLVTACEDGETVSVFEGDEVAFTTPAVMMVEDPLKGLYSWQGQWILEVKSQVFVSGKNLNEELGYAEIFNWNFIAGQPFFFFTKEEGGTVGVSYGLQELPQTYEQVPHYQCCEPAGFNPAFSPDMTWFYGLKEGSWYYVSMGVYQ